MKRTIYTALLSFPSKSDYTLIALPELQETSDLPCDTGSEKAELAKEFEGKKVDLDLVVEGWNSKKGKWAASGQAIEERSQVARQWLKARKEKDIVVVTHGAMLHYLTEDWAGSEKFSGLLPTLTAIWHSLIRPGTGWANTEYRTYTFDPASGSRASLVETQESITRRRGLEKPLGEAEQRNLPRTATVDAEKKQASVQAKV